MTPQVPHDKVRTVRVTLVHPERHYECRRVDMVLSPGHPGPAVWPHEGVLWKVVYPPKGVEVHWQEDGHIWMTELT